MRRILMLCLCLCPMLFSAESSTPASPRLAILPLKEEGKNTLGDISDTLNTLVANAFQETRAFQLVERHQIKTLLTESKFQHSGLVDETTAAELGKHLGVNYVLVGSYLAERISDYNLTITLSLRLVDVGNATIYKSFLETAEERSLGAALPKISRSLGAKVADLKLGDPHQLNKVVIVFAEGSVSCAMKGKTHTEWAQLSFFNEKRDDYTFLETEVGKLFPPDAKIVYETETAHNPMAHMEDFTKKHHPDAIVLITFDRTGKIHTFSQESEHRAEAHITFINPKNLSVIGVKNFSTSLIKGKLYEVFPLIKAELTQHIQKELAPLPFEP